MKNPKVIFLNFDVELFTIFIKVIHMKWRLLYPNEFGKRKPNIMLIGLDVEANMILGCKKLLKQFNKTK